MALSKLQKLQKLLSGTFSAPLKTLKGLESLSVGLRNCSLALPKRHKLFLLGFETAIWHVFSTPNRSMALSMLGFETALWHFRSATSCCYWASKLLSGTFSAPLKTLKTFPAAFDCLSLLALSFSMAGLRNWSLALPLPWPLQSFKSFRSCYLAGFQHPLKPSKASKAFLLGFETALWHFRSATSCFYWASKLLSGTFSAPLKTLPSKPSKPSQQLSTAFRCLLCPFPWPGFQTALWHFRSATTVSIGLRNCYLARFQHPLKPSKPSKPSQQLSTAFRCLLCPFPWPFQSATSCFYWASKLLSGTSSAPPTFPWPFQSFKKLQKLLSGTFSAPLKTLKGLKTLWYSIYTYIYIYIYIYKGGGNDIRDFRVCLLNVVFMHTFGAPFPCEDYVLRKGGKTHHPQNMKTTFHEQPRKSLISIHSIHCPTIYVYATYTFKNSIIFARLDYCTCGPFWPFPAAPPWKGGRRHQGVSPFITVAYTVHSEYSEYSTWSSILSRLLIYDIPMKSTIVPG